MLAYLLSALLLSQASHVQTRMSRSLGLRPSSPKLEAAVNVLGGMSFLAWALMAIAAFFVFGFWFGVGLIIASIVATILLPSAVILAAPLTSPVMAVAGLVLMVGWILP